MIVIAPKGRNMIKRPTFVLWNDFPRHHITDEKMKTFRIFQTTQDPDISTIQSLQASVETDHLDRIEGNVATLVACLRTGSLYSLLDIVRRQHAE